MRSLHVILIDKRIAVEKAVRMDEPSRVTDFGAIWRASALSMNADSQNIQDTESQLAGILESQASDDEAMPDRAPEPEVEVPTSSMLSAADAPSTPPAKGEGQNDEEMVLDTPTRDQSHTVPDINGSPVDEETQADAEDEPPDSLRAIPAFNESQMTKEGQSPNGQQANGAKKERLAFNPYDTAALNPRSPLEIGLNEQRLRAVSILCAGLDFDIEGMMLKCSKLPGSVDDSASFEFLQEDHTLGNALRHAIMKK